MRAAIFAPVMDDSRNREHQTRNAGTFKCIWYEQRHRKQPANSRPENGGHCANVQAHMPIGLPPQPDCRPRQGSEHDGRQRDCNQEILRLKKERCCSALGYIDTDQATQHDKNSNPACPYPAKRSMQSARPMCAELGLRNKQTDPSHECNAMQVNERTRAKTASSRKKLDGKTRYDDERHQDGHIAKKIIGLANLRLSRSQSSHALYPPF